MKILAFILLPKVQLNYFWSWELKEIKQSNNLKA